VDVGSIPASASKQSPGGETGRRSRLKICRYFFTVPVRFRPRAPYNDLKSPDLGFIFSYILMTGTGFALIKAGYLLETLKMLKTNLSIACLFTLFSTPLVAESKIGINYGVGLYTEWEKQSENDAVGLLYIQLF
jgi:hypothetical protein